MISSSVTTLEEQSGREHSQVPHQNIRDLVAMITVQGDTEFASVEQQRHLLETAPTDYDPCSGRIMAEEQRHGWQMASSHDILGQQDEEKHKSC